MFTVRSGARCGRLAAAIGRAVCDTSITGLPKRRTHCEKLAGIMARRVYCTYFDHHYLSRGLALYHSLQRHAPGARLWVLCLSERCFEIMQKSALPNLLPVRLSAFAAADPQTAATRPSRKPVEYYFTCTPGWTLYVAQREPEADWITY